MQQAAIPVWLDVLITSVSFLTVSGLYAWATKRWHVMDKMRLEPAQYLSPTSIVPSPRMLKSLQPGQAAMIDLDDLLVIKGRLYTLWNAYIWECPAARNTEWTWLRRIERYDRGFKVLLDFADKIQEKDVSWRSCAPISHVEMAQLWKP